jgi:hypothetical protein
MKVIRDLLVGNKFSAKALKNAIRSDMPLGSGWSKQELRNIVEVFNALADKKQNLWPTLTILKMVASQPENLSLGQELALCANSMIEKLIDSLDGGEIKTQDYFYLIHLLEIFQDCKVHHEANQTMLENLFIGWFAAEQLDPSIRTLLGIELLSAYRHFETIYDMERPPTKIRKVLRIISKQEINPILRYYTALITRENDVRVPPSLLQVKRCSYNPVQAAKNCHLICNQDYEVIYIFGNFGKEALIQRFHIEELTEVKLTRDGGILSFEALVRNEFRLSIDISLSNTTDMKELERLFRICNQQSQFNQMVTKKSQNKCAKSEIDLHIKFNEIETQKKDGSQDIFYSPVEDYQSPPYFPAPGSPQISDDATQAEAAPMATVTAETKEKNPGRWSPATTVTPLLPMPPPTKNIKTRKLANIRDQDIMSKLSDDSGNSYNIISTLL